MGSPPKLRQFPTGEEEVPAWFKNALPSLNAFFERVTALFEGQITQENVSEQKKVLELTTSDLPLTFNCELSRVPTGVRLAQAEVVTSGGSFSGAVDVSQWLRVENNRIRYTSIPGLNSGTKYKLTLFIY
jgi:hypothetical protein